MKIHMLSSRRGSENGFLTRVYDKGKEYDVSETMGKYFCKMGWAYNAEDDESSDLNINSVLTDIFKAIVNNPFQGAKP